MARLTLYHYDGCPYCQRVKDFMKQNKISLSLKDIHQDPSARAELATIGGKSQVPCLVIDGKALCESMDIIEWLKKNGKA